MLVCFKQCHRTDKSQYKLSDICLNFVFTGLGYRNLKNKEKNTEYRFSNQLTYIYIFEGSNLPQAKVCRLDSLRLNRNIHLYRLPFCLGTLHLTFMFSRTRIPIYIDASGSSCMSALHN